MTWKQYFSSPTMLLNLLVIIAGGIVTVWEYITPDFLTTLGISGHAETIIMAVGAIVMAIYNKQRRANDNPAIVAGRAVIAENDATK